MCRAQMNSRAQLRRHRQQPKQHAAVKRSSFSWNMTIFLLCRYPWSWNVVTLSTVAVHSTEATRSLCSSVPGAELTSSLLSLSVVLKQFTQIPLSAPRLFDLCSALSIILLKRHKSECYSWTIYFFGGKKKSTPTVKAASLFFLLLKLFLTTFLRSDARWWLTIVWNANLLCASDDI